MLGYKGNRLNRLVLNEHQFIQGLYPESAESVYYGRSSDLLHLPAAFPSAKRTVAEEYRQERKELTAAGTVPEFHRIPF